VTEDNPARRASALADPLPARPRVCDALVDILVENGVEVVFGLPGGPISPIHDALLDHPEVRHITVRHESGAMFGAAGYARASGKLGVAIVTSGPGMLNSMTGLASAHCDGSPILLLVGEVPRRVQGRGALQDGSAHGLEIVAMARHISKLAAELAEPGQAPLALQRAITTARSGRAGPVVLTLPMDVALAPLARPRMWSDVVLQHGVSPAALDEVAHLLARAETPLLLAGAGCRGGKAPLHLREVAERLGCPVATTLKGKGVFPEDHPLSLGVFGSGGHLSAHAYAESGIDVLIALGSSLGDLATDGWSPALQATQAFVHVDIDARQIGKSYRASQAVVASCEDFLAGLAERVQPLQRPPRAGRIRRHALPASAGMIAPHAAIAEIQEILPRDAIFTVDCGEHTMFAAHYLEIVSPDSFLVMTGLGSMGQSIGAAIGAQLAQPGRAVAAICGDGCFAMNAFEVATAVVENLPICVFVFNDQQFTMVEQGHATVYRRRPSYPIGGVDVRAVAAGLGATALRAEKPGDIRALRELVAARRGPIVVEVMVDPGCALPKRDRMAVMGNPR
jgi:acetolactate synthase-1/2/3 large subunit